MSELKYKTVKVFSREDLPTNLWEDFADWADNFEGGEPDYIPFTAGAEVSGSRYKDISDWLVENGAAVGENVLITWT